MSHSSFSFSVASSALSQITLILSSRFFSLDLRRDPIFLGHFVDFGFKSYCHFGGVVREVHQSFLSTRMSRLKELCTRA